MAYGRAIVLALLSLAVGACGRGGSVSTLSDDGNGQPAFNDDAPTDSYGSPPDSYQDPPSNTAQADFNDNAPSGGGSSPPPGGGGGGTPSCGAFCLSAQQAGCQIGGPGECESSCNEAVAEGEPCLEEAFEVYACIFASPTFSCVDGFEDAQIDEATLEACATQVTALIACDEANEPSGEDCTLEGDSCQGCPDDCSLCICSGVDATICAPYCG